MIIVQFLFKKKHGVGCISNCMDVIQTEGH